MKKYDQFINDKMNEGFFDVFKKLFSKITQYFNTTKGGKEVKLIYDKYIAIIKTEFKRQTDIELNIGADSIKKESTFSILYDYSMFITEELDTPTVDDTDASSLLGNTSGTTSGSTVNSKMMIDKLKQKGAILDKIILMYQQKALSEMDKVLQKYGGAEANPKLKVIIDNEKDQFILDFLNAKIDYLEKAGDRTIISKMKIDRDNLSKNLNNRWNSFDKSGDIKEGGQLLIGVYYRYTTPDGIKTIKITKQSPNKGKIFATYVLPIDGQVKDQEFSTENIDSEFVPESGVTYNYYSETNKALIKVTVDKYDDKTKQLDVTSDKGNKFKGHVGVLRDKVVETPPTTETTPPVDGKQSPTIPNPTGTTPNV